MPVIPSVDPNLDTPKITFVAHKQSNIRLQLEAEDDVRDVRGRIIERGKSVVAKFSNGQFTTNKPNIIKAIEDSYKFKAGLIERQDVLIERAYNQQLEDVMQAVESNPELARKLKSKLTKMQMAKAKARKAQEELEVVDEIEEADEAEELGEEEVEL